MFPAKILAAIGAVALTLSHPVRADVLLASDITSALAFAARQADKTMAALGTDYATYPRSGGDTSDWTRTVGPDDWTSAFFPVELASLYRATGDKTFLTAAVNWNAPIAAQTPNYLAAQDMQGVGMLYALTGDPALKAVLMANATALAAQYSPIVGVISNEPLSSGLVQVAPDAMNGLGTLSFASANGGDPSFVNEAVQHAITTSQVIVRPDGSTYGQAIYDATTGAQLYLGVSQGYSDSSDWQRGLTWAMNGYADLYEQTKNPALLLTAQKLADHFIAVSRSDCTSWWDAADPGIPNVPIDTSATALGDLALTKLGTLVTDPSDAARYEAAAQCGLKTLITSDEVTAPGGDAILLHGNNGGGGDGLDVSLIFGDAPFVEALTAQQELLDGLPIDWTMNWNVDPVSADDLVGAPEPGSVTLFSAAIAGLIGLRRRRRLSVHTSGPRLPVTYTSFSGTSFSGTSFSDTSFSGANS